MRMSISVWRLVCTLTEEGAFDFLRPNSIAAYVDDFVCTSVQRIRTVCMHPTRIALEVPDSTTKIRLPASLIAPPPGRAKIACGPARKYWNMEHARQVAALLGLLEAALPYQIVNDK